MTRLERLFIRLGIIVVILVSVSAIATGGFATSVGAQSVDDIRTTLSDTEGDSLEDQVRVEVTVSNVETGKTVVDLGKSSFDVDLSPTEKTDGEQAQFVTPLDTDGDGTNEAVEFVDVVQGDGLDATYTVTADLSDQADGETGTVDVELGGGTTGSASFTVGGQENSNSGDRDGDGDDDGGVSEEDETDEQSDGTDGVSEEDETDEQSDGTDGGGADVATGETDGAGDDSGGNGMPGFTAVVALFALFLTAAYYRK